MLLSPAARFHAVRDNRWGIVAYPSGRRTCSAADINAPAGTAKLVEATTAVLSRDLESSFLFFEDEEAPSKPRMAEKNAKAQEAVAEAATENGISARLVVKCHIALVKCVDKLVVVEDFVQGCHHRFIVA
ncbi:hypothetical protein KRP22_008669 [Phytophthora ramorum]|nr:hypothetical protein KRP22_7501 [Phytophthora ramorum]